MKNWVGLVLAIFASTCQAYWDPPAITPESPAAGSTVSVIYSGGLCDALSSEPGYPQITRNGSAIRVLMRTIHQTSSELCFLPVLSTPVEIGAFEAGTYTLTVDVLYYDIFGMHVDTLGVLPLNVSGSPSGDPLGAPALSDFGLLTLVIALIAAVRFRRSLLGLALALAIGCAPPPPAVASEPNVQPQIGVEIMLTTAPGAPTAEQLVNRFSRSFAICTSIILRGACSELP